MIARINIDLSGKKELEMCSGILLLNSPNFVTTTNAISCPHFKPSAALAEANVPVRMTLSGVNVRVSVTLLHTVTENHRDTL